MLLCPLRIDDETIPDETMGQYIDGAGFAWQPCYPQETLRFLGGPVALRPTFSSGLPFSGFVHPWVTIELCSSEMKLDNKIHEDENCNGYARSFFKN
jgi:hypothetical protein